jgi:hypothetical protein
MTLNITKGGKHFAPKLYVYGREGIGKTTFVTHCPNPLIIDFDGGAERYNIDILKVGSSDELINALIELRQSEYKTIAIDTLESLERMIYAEICRKAKVDSIEKAFGGFGKGYIAAGETMSRILNALSALLPYRKMPVVLGQCEIKSISDPEGEIAMYAPRAHKHVAVRVMEWADIIGFATREKSSATGTGDRVMFTSPTTRAMAKSRLPLPEQIDLAFAPIAAVLKQAKTANTESKATPKSVKDEPSESNVESNAEGEHEQNEF